MLDHFGAADGILESSVTHTHTPTHCSSYEPGVAEILDENLVDEVVLSKRLDHHHSLSAQLVQDIRDIQRLKQTHKQTESFRYKRKEIKIYNMRGKR